jgi:hypothetical protein
MRISIVGLVFALALAACGGGSDGGGSTPDLEPTPTSPDPNAVVDEALRGTWGGPLTVTVQGLAIPIERQASIVVGPFVGLDGRGGANLRGLCPGYDLSGLVAPGAGRTVSWTGTFACPATAAGECAVTVTYSSLSLTLDAAGTTLSGQGAGSVVSAGPGPCATSAPATVAFTGTKQP